MARVTGIVWFIIAVAAFAATYNTVVTLTRTRISDDDYQDEEDVMLPKSSVSSRSASTISLKGVTARPLDRIQQVKKKKRMFHTAMTCNDSPYTKWQSRIMYFWYLKYKDEPESEMGGFTRGLHSGRPDNLMHEIPTFVVDPLPPGMDKGYVVLNRPWAFVQWIKKAEFEEDYVYMAEPDHIIVRPIPNLATEQMPAAFVFFYITPKPMEKYLRKWYPKERGPITNIDPIGNSPVIIKKDDLKKIAPLWMNISIEFKEDPAIDKAFGWVQEMYAYATAAAVLGYTHILRKDFMIQPPWDVKLGNTYIIHYTYGCDYNLEGKFTPGKVGAWHFDKRDHQSAIPRNLSYPPKGAAPATFELIRRLNEATASLDWVQGAT